jgi:4-aminobutyrate aminotransferase/(S)-3-amino-2-methylpropionate transaminase
MINTKNRIIKDNFTLDRGELTANRHKNEPLALGDQVPVVWHKAKDFNIYDENGNKWIDMTAGIFATNSGHANEKIKEAIKNQLDSDLLFAYQYETRIRDRFVNKLLDITPDYLNKAVLLNTGSEATDACYKLIKLWAKKNNKKYIICFNGSYHGRVLGSALMCGSKVAATWSGIKDDDIVFIDFPYYVDDTFDPRMLPPKEQIAAFFLETYQGWGACMYPPEYMKSLYGFAREIGALVCFDEIQAGFYRMGDLFGFMTYGDFIEPDLISLGKGISSCLPMSAVLGKSEIIDIDQGANLSGTHAGNAICCAAALANLEFLTDETFQEELKHKVKCFEERCQQLLHLDAVLKVNYRGMVAGIVLKSTEVANDAVNNCLLNGVLPVCTFRESIKLGPPLTISIDAIEEAFDVIEDAIKEASYTNEQ